MRAALDIPEIVRETSLDGLPPPRRGKVRDIYDLGEEILLVATDRLSAFDCVLPNGIPYKGAVLNGLAAFWFRTLRDEFPSHFLTDEPDRMPDAVRAHAARIRGRASLCRKVSVFPVECVVRGYMAPSVWSEYRAKGTVAGVAAPEGIPIAGRFPEPLFTPTTKAERGHDEAIPFGEVERLVGADVARTLRDRSLALYARAHAIAGEKGIIICDTKLEWGRDGEGRIVVCDEVLTPDSSRFVDAATWREDEPMKPLDKQYVRNFLIESGWSKEPPAPALPDEVVAQTRDRYLGIFERLTGRRLF